MPGILLPEAVQAVFRDFFTCELTTIGKDGRPSTWPILPLYVADPPRFIILTPVALSQKVKNVRRNPRVSLLYSEPKGSGLVDPPAVLVQGNAAAWDGIITSLGGFDAALLEAAKMQAHKITRDQPGLRLYMRNAITRYWMDWYFMRLMVTVTPCRISWWERGDFQQAPQRWEMAHAA